ncbi:hypothetical protein OU800_08895 [Pseudomonas sp. GOM7]|uniref:hypothetical protein n=1 Tax=Pseudomonas sp. GOM7 TaxID=2998079 RepID=UPI00227B3346|nr:hypothetical protein [Pseudomonas sp. GOM7]WAJ39328.1 hypothetical protein OU800_08895 [Pseudomonas sp. GOM7]
MRNAILLSLCLGLVACSSNPQRLYQDQVANSTTALAKTPAEALRNASAQPMQVAPGWHPKQWKITAEEPRLLIDNTPSNYRVFSVSLKASKPFQIKVDSWCVNACLGFSKYVLAPYLILLDQDSKEVSRAYRQIQGSVGVIGQTLTGQVESDGIYYLIVAADNHAPGELLLVDNVRVTGNGMTANAPTIQVGMGSSPFGSVAAYLVEPQ